MSTQPTPAPVSSGFTPAFIDKMRDLLGSRFSMAKAICTQHGSDASALDPMPPDAVAFAQSLEHIVGIVKVCYEHEVPIVAYGAGTSLEGQLQAIHGGVCIDLSEMNQIIEIRPDDMDVTVQPGVTRKQLNAALHDSGLFFPIDPGADASIGGMAATRASGTNAVRYGTMRENVMSMVVVLADGRVIRTGGRARKSAAGYDLTRLFVGSAGTLGIIAEITVKLHPLPEAVSSAVCTFPTVDAATRTVIEAIQSGIPVARMELMDALSVKAINAYSKTGLDEAPTLFLEFHGSPTSVREQAETVQELASINGGTNFQWADLPEDRSRLWQARHDAYFASLAVCPGKHGMTTDVVVPISALGRCIEETIADFEQHGLTAPILGHVGDGNFHAVMLVDPNDGEEIARAHDAQRRLVQRALAMDGSCTGEHGIGLTKQEYMPLEFGEDAIDVMVSIKTALDPKNLMNPGKIFPLRRRSQPA